MYLPKYELNSKILKNVSDVEAAKAVIQNSPLLPLYERRFKKEAVARRVHFSTAIEGNYLNINEVTQIISDTDNLTQKDSDEGLIARNRDIIEVVNYRNVVSYIEKFVAKKSVDNDFILSVSIIETMHKMVLKNIKDDVAGKYREKVALTINYLTGEKLYPYEFVENISAKLSDLLAWYNSQSHEDVHPVLKAGLLHLEFVRIHPFEEGNGRMARALATLSLSMDGYDVNHFFCLDEYYDSDAQGYYENLGDGFSDATKWLEYFSLGMAIEFSRIKDRVIKISKDAKIKRSIGQMFISERQEKIIEWLNLRKFFSNQDFAELFPDLSDDTVLRELKGLIDGGIITKKGKTKSSRYELK